MKIQISGLTLRFWTPDDCDSLYRYANNPSIAATMRDAFPSPYTSEDAERFITSVAQQEKNLFLAIEYQGEAVGGIGIHPLDDVYCRTAEIGYWIGEPFWGKGIMTKAVQSLVPVSFERYEIKRIQAGIFSGNPASMRVLEKSGFVLEAIHKDAIFKNGAYQDELLFVRFR